MLGRLIFNSLILNNSTKLCKPQQFYVARHSASTTAPSATDPMETIFSLEQAHIDEVVKVTPSLSGITLESWHRTHETFLNHGLPTANFLRIVTGNPSVLMHSQQRIGNCLEYWRNCQFGEKLMHPLITKYPEFLDVTDGHRLLMRVTYLKGFVFTDKNVWRALMNCPNLLEQSERCIEQKISYFTEVMRLDIPEIVKSEALSKGLEEIQCRHVFLLRLGIFKPRSLKAAPHEPTKNPRLHQITDTSEKTFATKTCHVSLAEYEAFKEIFGREKVRRQGKATQDEDELYSDSE